MTDYVADLRRTVDRGALELLEVDEQVAAWRPGPNRWSAKEILGHLIDSASNNHQRFVRARWQDSLVFPGYRQDDWVSAQRYQDAPWGELVVLWREFNRHIARAMAAVPADIRDREHRTHNLHEIAWRTIPADSPATLDYFMADYVGHLHHHLEQIRALVRQAPAAGAIGGAPTREMAAEFDLTTGIAVLKRTPRTLRAMLDGVPREWIDATEGPGTWSPRVIVGHLIHGERTDWIPRARIILAQGANRRFTPFDRFAQLGESRPLAELLDEFESARAASLATLASWALSDAQLELEGEHPELGPVTLRQLLATWVAHDLGHIAQASRVMAKRYRQAVGPWRAYLPVMDR